jgi:hypothetical protein
MGCSYRLRPTIAGETAGEGTIDTVEANEGAKDGGMAEGIILVDDVLGSRVERIFKRKEVERRVWVTMRTEDEMRRMPSYLSDRALHVSRASINTNFSKASRARVG